jgi:thiamine-phosphate pyrophosphorylase
VTTKRLLCLVTDRRRLARTLGRPPADARALLVAQLEGAVRGGIDVVQIREPDLEARELAALMRDALHVAHGSGVRVMVNDRLDVALAAGADGIHLRENSFSVVAVRGISAALTIGRSVHSAESAARSLGADYLIAGTVFPTESKTTSNAPLGMAGLEAIVRAASGTPVLAIGGVTAERLRLIVRSGAAGVAAIGAFLPTRIAETAIKGTVPFMAISADQVAAEVEKNVKTLRFAFDTASTVF